MVSLCVAVAILFCTFAVATDAHNVTEAHLGGGRTVFKYFHDAACCVPGGPVGLVSNPLVVPVGQCSEILTQGAAVKVLSCNRTAVVAQTFLSGCSGPLGPAFHHHTGACVPSPDCSAWVIVSCLANEDGDV